MVKRYRTWDDPASLCEDGEYVKFTDYDALAARLASQDAAWDKSAALYERTESDYRQACRDRDDALTQLAEAEATNRHRDRQIAAIVTWLEANQPDVFRRGLWDVIPRAADSAR